MFVRAAEAGSGDDRMSEVVTQLSGIGGGRPLGFGTNRVLSLPDGVAQALNDYRQSWEVDKEGKVSENGYRATEAYGGNGTYTQTRMALIGDLCPECGEAAVVNEEGCRKCYACAFSEC